MIVQFSINPMDSEHISQDIHAVTELLEQAGFEYQVGPIGTSIKGPWEEVMPILKKCHELVAKSHARVLTTIIIDDHKGKEHSLESSVESVFDEEEPELSTGT